MLFALVFASVFLFAQVGEAAPWLQVVLQFGSLGILGYFLLKVQPDAARSDRAARMDEIRLMVSMFQGERESFAERTDGIEAEMRRLREQRVCKIDTPASQWFKDSDLHRPPPPGTGEGR